VNDLHYLLQDAVVDVEPADRIDELRARTAKPARAAARSWFWAAGAAALATAAAVAVVALVNDGPSEPGPAGHDRNAAAETLVAAYFPGDPAQGSGLYREFDLVATTDPLQAALERIQQPPSDPDYQTTWPAGALRSATVRGSTIDVELGDVEPNFEPDDLMTQQVVYTLQGAVGERLPVRFLQGGDVVLGPVAASPKALNPVSISDPAEGNEYDGSMIARGRIVTSGGLWELTDPAGRIVRQGAASPSASGAGLRPWEVTVDLGGLEPADYTFTVHRIEVAAPGRTTFHPSTDTRTISVR
jgi:hypothetical protein